MKRIRKTINNVTPDTLIFNEFIYKSVNYGLFKVLEWDGTKQLRAKLYTVQFKNTGNAVDRVRIDRIRCGEIKDRKLISDENDKFFNTVYQSEKYGPYIVLKGEEYIDIEKDEKYKKYYSIQFLNTMNIRRHIEKHRILSGKIMDLELKNKELYDSIYNSNGFGQYKLSPYEETGKYKMYFLETGFIKVIDTKQHSSKHIKDPYYCNTSDIGYQGQFSLNVNVNSKLYILLQSRWNAMLSRCYNNSDKHYNSYGGKLVTVDPRWHCFANYFNDVQQLYGFDEEKIVNGEMDLDKDLICDQLISEGKLINKVYSPLTCIWVSRTENANIRDGKEVKIDLTHRIETESDLKFVINPIEQQDHFNNYMRARIMRDHYQ